MKIMQFVRNYSPYDKYKIAKKGKNNPQLLESCESPLKCCCGLFCWECGGCGSNKRGGVI